VTETILPTGWNRPAGYSEGVVAEGTRLLHVAGQFGVRDGESAVNSEDGFAAQWTGALRRVCTVVESAGGAAEDIVALRVYVTDLAAYRASLRDIAGGYRETLGKHFPAITMVAVAGLVDDAALVEIEATAVLTGS
jgi:enamine deaminase RidA (YjgF/YER057c/UK114 family)